jgi:hypothetical protein
MRPFRTVTTVLLIGLLLSAVAHIMLLMSDSPDYRQWVYVQMALHVLAAGLLWYVRHSNLYALAGFALVALSGVYINAVHLNYGSGSAIWLLPLILLVVYVGWGTWVEKRESSRGEV